MAKNDRILLDGIIDDRLDKMLPSSRRDEVFEYLAFEQILKDFDLSREEIESGWVDGRNDGGIDGFFIIVNGTLLTDAESFVWPRSGSELSVWIITCKHRDTFRQAPLDNLAATVTELLDLGLSVGQLKADYSDPILQCRENLQFAYRKLAARMTKFSINFAYASRGDSADIGDSVRARAEQIRDSAKEFFGICEATFSFYGCTEIVALHRKKPVFSLELPFFEVLSKGERYVLLTRLRDYYQFVSDKGKLRRYLFDSNVRDYMGLNRVNDDIRETLENAQSPDFWWLNNGVTILVTSASVIGKIIQLQDVQIVNGLQTTQSIFNYFLAGGQDHEQRSVLVKVIVSGEDAVRDAIIRATNNQTSVEIASLRATEKIQRDIEDILLRNGLYYDRRKNYYSNLGHSPCEIISPLYLASGFVNLILKAPVKAAGLKSRFMRSIEAYQQVFSTKTSITIWPKIARFLKKTDEVLEHYRPTGTAANERFIKNWRQITCLLTVSRLIGKFDYSTHEFDTFSGNLFTDEAVRHSWEYIESFEEHFISGRGWRKTSSIRRLCQSFAQDFELSGADKIAGGLGRNRKADVDGDFALRVLMLLPPQPWKPGVHKKIVRALQCTTSEYFGAVKLLIEKGLCNEQKDGVVYDRDGNVLAYDAQRVDPVSMRLLDANSPNDK